MSTKIDHEQTKSPIRRVGLWLNERPSTLVAGAAGLLIGTLLTLPLGWKLPDSMSALVGAIVGAGAAVGGAIWAANVKQIHENQRADSRDRRVAAIVACAIAPEIASARRNMLMIASRMEEAIAAIDKGARLEEITAVLGAAHLDSGFCERFIDRLDAFGEDAPRIMETVGAILESNSSSAALVEPIRHVEWRLARSLLEMRVVVLWAYAPKISETLRVLASYHPSKDEVAAWADLGPSGMS